MMSKGYKEDSVMGSRPKFDPTKFGLADGDDLLPESFPCLYNLSAAFLYQFVPRPRKPRPLEFAYVPVNLSEKFPSDNSRTRVEVTIADWNAAWEAGHLRSEFIPLRDDFPQELRWLTRKKDVNLYLIPDGRDSKIDAFSPLYHLLPLKMLQRFNLPALSRGIWPPWVHQHYLDCHITKDFDEWVARAFAHHVWPLLDSGSLVQSFSKDDPIRLLAHNLNFWLPFACVVTENKLRKFGRVSLDDEKQAITLKKLRRKLPPDVRAARPLRGGPIWEGEGDAWEATKELVQVADRHGQLRGIIDAVRSHRVKDDFSSRWSYAKEDFERKLYHKRSKVRVSFVELDETIAVHSSSSELHDNLVWEDFLALLDVKERRIVVCLKNGETRLGDVAKTLGYANHSPISKALARIRRKVKRHLGF